MSCRRGRYGRRGGWYGPGYGYGGYGPGYGYGYGYGGYGYGLGLYRPYLSPIFW